MDPRFEKLLRPLVRQATTVKLSKAPNAASKPATRTKFGGIPYSEAGDSWPICPGCERGLNFICQLNLADCLHPEPVLRGLFVFYYCWECMPWGLPGDLKGTWLVRAYPRPGVDRIVQIQHGVKSVAPTIPCSVEMVIDLSLPDWDGIDVVCPAAAELSSKLDLDKPWAPYKAASMELTGNNGYATRIGGYPKWVQAESTPSCSVCTQRMRLLAQIDSEDEAGIMWGDVGCVYLFVCEQHPSELKLELQCH